jgi:hypothetical protein
VWINEACEWSNDGEYQKIDPHIRQVFHYNVSYDNLLFFELHGSDVYLTGRDVTAVRLQYGVVAVHWRRILKDRPYFL